MQPFKYLLAFYRLAPNRSQVSPHFVFNFFHIGWLLLGWERVYRQGFWGEVARAKVKNQIPERLGGQSSIFTSGLTTGTKSGFKRNPSIDPLYGALGTPHKNMDPWGLIFKI